MHPYRLKVLNVNSVLIGLLLVVSCNREKEKPLTNYSEKLAIRQLPKTLDSTKKEPEKTKKEPEKIRQHSPEPQQDLSLSYKLASINAGRNVLPSDPNIKKFDTILTKLSSKYVETEQQIADITVKSHEMLEEEGISTSLLAMMQGMNRLVSESSTVNKYADYMAAYHTLRKSGDSHEDAVLNVKALLQSLGIR